VAESAFVAQGAGFDSVFDDRPCGFRRWIA